MPSQRSSHIFSLAVLNQFFTSLTALIKKLYLALSQPCDNPFIDRWATFLAAVQTTAHRALALSMATAARAVLVHAAPNAGQAPANPARGRSASRHDGHGQTSHRTASRPMPDFRAIFDQNPHVAGRAPRATEISARAPSRSRSTHRAQGSASELRGRSRSRSRPAASGSRSQFSRSTSVHSRSASRPSSRSGRSRSRDAISHKTRDAQALRELRPIRYRASNGQIYWCESLKRVQELRELQDAGKLPGPRADQRPYPGYSGRGPLGPIPPWDY